MPATSNFDVSVSVGALSTGAFTTGCPASIPAEHIIAAAHTTPYPIYCLFTVAPPDAALA